MATSLADPAWKPLLPAAFAWAENVEISFSDGGVGAAMHAIPVVVKGEKSGGLQLAAGVKGELAQKAMTVAKQFGWKGKGSPLKAVVDGFAVILVAVSRVNTTGRQIARQFGMDLGRALKDDDVQQLVIFKCDGLLADEIFGGLATSFYSLGLFKGSRFKSNSPVESFPQKLVFCGFDSGDSQLMGTARHLAQAGLLTRMLQDAPANWLDPIRFGQIAEDLAKDLGMKCNRRGREELEAMGAGSYLSVAAGSPKEPQLITLEIDGIDNTRSVALIGKGLTFDTGGNSIKPSVGMGEMKYDMSGGAAVLGAAFYLAKVKPPTKVVCVIGAVENMPGGSATRPGDVVMAMNGKTIDIQNTDAEGRLVLADCLHYANTSFNPELMIDIATLTGAVLHGLGHTGAAVMANDQCVADLVMESSRSVGEPFWQLPLWPELDKEVKGDVSDLVNIGKPSVRAGTIMGGVFLREFVGETKWAHLDIAGTGWFCKATGYPSAGGSGYGVRTLVEVCQRFGEWSAK